MLAIFVMVGSVVLLGCISRAKADQGEVTLGGGAAFVVADEFGGALAARLGTGNWSALETVAHAGVDSRELTLGIDGGLVLSWDVLTWVPELAVRAGARHAGQGYEAVVAFDISARRYFGLRWAGSLSLGGRYGSHSGWEATAGVMLWRGLL